MDWNSIILAVIGVVFSWETWNNVKYRRENKKLKEEEVKLKENEVKTSSIDAQKAQIELGDLFMEKSKEMFQQMQELQEQTLLATKKNGIDNEDIIKQLNEVIAEQKRLAEEQQRQGAELKRLSEGQEHMVSFLNGEYQSFLTENGFKAKKKSRYEK
jgi:hypothetical protein